MHLVLTQQRSCLLIQNYPLSIQYTIQSVPFSNAALNHMHIRIG